MLLATYRSRIECDQVRFQTRDVIRKTRMQPDLPVSNASLAASTREKNNEYPTRPTPVSFSLAASVSPLIYIQNRPNNARMKAVETHVTDTNA